MLCSNECCPSENNHIPAALSAVNMGDALKLSMVFSGENTSCDLPHLTLHNSLDVQWERVVHRSRFASPTSCDICGFLVSISGAFRVVSPISSPSPGRMLSPHLLQEREPSDQVLSLHALLLTTVPPPTLCPWPFPGTSVPSFRAFMALLLIIRHISGLHLFETHFSWCYLLLMHRAAQESCHQQAGTLAEKLQVVEKGEAAQGQPHWACLHDWRLSPMFFSKETVLFIERGLGKS